MTWYFFFAPISLGDTSVHVFAMPANGGAFFGFAIIVAAALVTWGIIALVNVASDNNDDSGDDYASAREADSDIQVCTRVLCVFLFLTSGATIANQEPFLPLKPHLCLALPQLTYNVISPW